MSRTRGALQAREADLRPCALASEANGHQHDDSGQTPGRRRTGHPAADDDDACGMPGSNSDAVAAHEARVATWPQADDDGHDGHVGHAC